MKGYFNLWSYLKRSACGVEWSGGCECKLVKTHNDNYVENIDKSHVYIKFRSDKIETYNHE